MGMKRILMCATAAAALVSVGAVANADDEGWYTRADVGYSFAGNLDHQTLLITLVAGLVLVMISATISGLKLPVVIGLAILMYQQIQLEQQHFLT